MYLPVFLAAYFIFSIAISIKDIRTRHVPRLALLTSVAASLLFQFIAYEKSKFLTSLFGAAVGIGIFSLAYFFSKKRLGLADIWYAGLIGSVFGPAWWHAIIIVSCVFGAAYMLIFRAGNIPFIPFMASASGIVTPFFLQSAAGDL